uniref:ORF2 n=1 Tax=Bremia lactucae associated fusagravirus 1 TaxID=2719799 RepID=A0A6G9EMW4_9VIRU|nr:MAG: ORF2 [Bremia lactucae associated fusagravirus 1]
MVLPFVVSQAEARHVLACRTNTAILLVNESHDCATGSDMTVANKYSNSPVGVTFSKGGWIRDLTREGVEPNPGPVAGEIGSYGSIPTDSVAESGQRVDVVGAVPNGGNSLAPRYETNVPEQSHAALAEASMPRIADLGGVFLLPTQLAVLGASSHLNSGYNPNLYPRELTERLSISVDLGGRLNQTTPFERHQRYNVVQPLTLRTPQQAAAPRSLAIRLSASLFSGELREDPRNMVSTVAMLDNVAFVDDDKAVKKVETALSRFRMMGGRGEGVASWRASAADRLRNASMLYSRVEGTGQSYVRWFTVAWLDFFVQMTRRKSAATVHTTTPVVGHRGVNLVGLNARAQNIPAGQGPIAFGATVGEDAFWNNYSDFIDGDAFLIDASSQRDSILLGLTARYAGNWPHVNTSMHNGTAAAPTDVVYPLASRVHIPGARTVYIHFGDKDVPDMVNWQAPVDAPNSTDIQRTISWMVETTGAYSDCAVGFEMAAARAFGVDNRLHQNAARGHRLFNALYDEDQLQLPRDATLPAYFYPFRHHDRVAFEKLDILHDSQSRVYEVGRLMNLSLMVGRQWAFKALSLTGDALNPAGRGRLAALHTHRICNRVTPDTLSILDIVTKNAIAHMYHWAPSNLVLNSNVLGVTEPGASGNVIGNYFSRLVTPFLLHPYHSVWTMFGLPDFMALPFTNGTVKWPKDKAYPLKNAMVPISEVRLGATLPPLTYKYWVGDGGAEFSAQYYLSENCGADPAVTENCRLRAWDKPMEFNLPAAATGFTVPRMREVGLESYMVPGTLCSYNHVNRITKAYGLALDPAIAGGNSAWNDIATASTGVAPALVYTGPKRFVTEPADLQDYTLLALSNQSTGAFAGMVMVPSQELLSMRTSPESPAYTQYMRPPLMDTPSALANDNSPETSGTGGGRKGGIVARSGNNFNMRGSVHQPGVMNSRKAPTAGVKQFNKWQKVRASGVQRKVANVDSMANMPTMPYKHTLGVSNGKVFETNNVTVNQPVQLNPKQAEADANRERKRAAQQARLEIEELEKAIAATKRELEAQESLKKMVLSEQQNKSSRSKRLGMPGVSGGGAIAALGTTPGSTQKSYKEVVSSSPKPPPPNIAPNDVRAMQIQTGVALDQSGTLDIPVDPGEEVGDNTLKEIAEYTSPLN